VVRQPRGSDPPYNCLPSFV